MHKLELNPYWKDGGTGLPPEEMTDSAAKKGNILDSIEFSSFMIAKCKLFFEDFCLISSEYNLILNCICLFHFIISEHEYPLVILV